MLRECFELPCTLREILLLAAVLTHAPLVPIRLVSSLLLLSPLVNCSAPILLLLGRWSHPAGPGIVLLTLPMSPLMWLRISPLLLLLLWGRLLLMVLWLLLLVATSTIVVALGWVSAIAASPTGSISNPGSAAARMGNG